MFNNMKAIILLAGDSSRMGSLCLNTPKCLLKLEKNKTMIEHQLQILKSCNIKDIVLVLGFKQELIKKKVKSLSGLNKKRIIIYSNPLYKITENAFSLWISKESFDDDLIIINGDVLFSKEALVDLIKDKNTYSLLVQKKKCDKEDQKVEVDNHSIIKIGKKISLIDAFGEFLGIGKIRKKGSNLFKRKLFEEIEKNPLIYWPEVFNSIIEKNYKVNAVVVNSLYSDMDKKEDYLKIQKILKKQIKK